MNITDFTLNENQRRAVDWTEGPLLVLAGPGSGKTLVLTLRAARLLQEDPEASVLALTFTTNAASEMRERLDKMLGERADRAHLCTFHSFAGDILRQHGSHVGIQPDYSLITLEEDRIALLEEIISELTCDTSLVPSDRKNLLVLLDRLFAESYNGEQTAVGLAQTPPWVPVLFEAYCNKLQKNNRLDYGGLLHFSRKLLSQSAGVARLMRLAWQFVCVDEFHDTNRAQYDLLRLLAGGKQPNLFVVADDDQIIYQWNGASPERLFALRADYNMDVIQLPENFRCPPIIIELANNLIINNQTRTTDKEPLIARKFPGESDILKAQIFTNEEDEVASISPHIIENGWNPEDCAVLARTIKLLQKAAQSLEQAGLKAFLAQRKNEFECSSIKWMHAALRLANARHDRELLRRVCVAWQEFTASVIEVEDVDATAALNGGDFLRAWLDTAFGKLEHDRFRDLLVRLRQDLADRLLFIDLLEWFWSQAWMEDPLESEEVNTWKELHGALMREHSPENVTLYLYLQEMDLKSKAPARVPGSISCLTVHGAKGLEFKHVFLIGMADEVFPSYQAVQKGASSREMEEERRNCFVAITRVKETLHISWAQRYNGYQKKPSRFIEEMGVRGKMIPKGRII